MKPEIDVFGLPVKTFGLMFALGFIAAGALIARRFRETDKPVDWAYELVFAGLIGGVVGARLWYMAENLDDVREDFFGTLFSGSGLTWYGGALGGALGVCLWARRKDFLGLTMLDVCAPALMLGYAIGRIGCQLSGDGDYGKPWDGPWAMAYPDGVVPTDEKVHPTPVYEALATGAAAWFLWSRRDAMAPGRLFALYLVLAGLERFLVEFLRRNEAVALGLTAAQWVSLVMLGAGVLWLTRKREGANLETRAQVSGSSGR